MNFNEHNPVRGSYYSIYRRTLSTLEEANTRLEMFVDRQEGREHERRTVELPVPREVDEDTFRGRTMSGFHGSARGNLKWSLVV